MFYILILLILVRRTTAVLTEVRASASILVVETSACDESISLRREYTAEATKAYRWIIIQHSQPVLLKRTGTELRARLIHT